MANKKLYSLRVDVDLLDALRTKADESGKTVSELMTTYSRKGLAEDSDANGHEYIRKDGQPTENQALESASTKPVQVGTPIEINGDVKALIEGLQSQIDELKRDVQKSSK